LEDAAIQARLSASSPAAPMREDDCRPARTSQLLTTAPSLFSSTLLGHDPDSLEQTGPSQGQRGRGGDGRRGPSAEGLRCRAGARNLGCGGDPGKPRANAGAVLAVPEFPVHVKLPERRRCFGPGIVSAPHPGLCEGAGQQSGLAKGRCGLRPHPSGRITSWAGGEISHVHVVFLSDWPRVSRNEGKLSQTSRGFLLWLPPSWVL
jgi:hypothetical protein